MCIIETATCISILKIATCTCILETATYTCMLLTATCTCVHNATCTVMYIIDCYMYMCIRDCQTHNVHEQLSINCSHRKTNQNPIDVSSENNVSSKVKTYLRGAL